MAAALSAPTCWRMNSSEPFYEAISDPHPHTHIHTVRACHVPASSYLRQRTCVAFYLSIDRCGSERANKRMNDLAFDLDLELIRSLPRSLQHQTTTYLLSILSIYVSWCERGCLSLCVYV